LARPASPTCRPPTAASEVQERLKCARLSSAALAAPHPPASCSSPFSPVRSNAFAHRGGL
jgi:hypothetical protein